jgi:hypothetical protein
MKISIFNLFAVMDFTHQKYFYSISAGLVIFLLSIFLPGQLWALPETAVDFNQNPGTFTITTTSTAAPNILRSVTITCPSNGSVVAMANGGLEYEAPVPTLPGTMAFSISRNSTSIDPTHELRIFGNYVNALYTGVVHIQRADNCVGGATHTYRFLGTRGSGTGNAFIRQPSLILMFFLDRF